jgi:large subunit ribosomal protein L23
MKHIHDVIIKPVLSEKSYDLIPVKKYTFQVDRRANKIQIRQAVEEIFGVQVKSVTTANQKGKLKRQGRTQGFRPDTKKAYVTLTEESKKIEFFESMSQ